VALKKFIGFALAGGSATVVNFSFFLALLTLGVDVIASSAIGYVSGIAISFILNKAFVFKSSNSVSLVRYFALYFIALICQLALLALLLEFKIEAWVANGIAVAVVLVANYFAMRKFVFHL
jgi:putative flippase GtrA